MPVFFSSPRGYQRDVVTDKISLALATDKITDPAERHQKAAALSEGTVPGVGKIVWPRVVAAMVLLAVLFVGALLVAPTSGKASETLFHCFELLFTATLGLIGIEAARNG